MKKITYETLSALESALQNKEYLNEFVKIEVEDSGQWIELYYNTGLGYLRIREILEICDNQHLSFCLISHPTHIKFLLWPFNEHLN